MNRPPSLLTAVGRIVRELVRTAVRQQRRATEPRRWDSAERPPRRGAAPQSSQTPPPLSDHYPGDYQGMPAVTYAPVPGRRPDPGEVVWTWVPFEEDHTRGKDRPVLLVGRDGEWLLGLPMTSLDHDRDAAQEAAEGRYWHDIGRGPWDPKGRSSEVRLNRVVRIDPRGVRRVSAHVSAATFDAVVAGMRRRIR